MIIPSKKDAIHKAWLCRVLERIADDPVLPSVLYFKGGTCASLLGWLDRFSVDLDFDYAGDAAGMPGTRMALERIFNELDLVVKDASKKGIQYFLRYEAEGRNTLTIDTSFPLYPASTYAPQRIQEIDRILTCQTIETMVAHKICAIIDRYEKSGGIAGRDIYDIHYFFMKGYSYSHDVIRERSGTDVRTYLLKLYAFVEREVTDTLISQDLNYLLLPEKFQRIRKVLKREVLSFLNDEIARI